MKKRIGILIATTLAVLLAACGAKPSATKPKQTLTWMENSAIVTNDLSHATDTVSFQTLMNTQEGIYRLSDQGKKVNLALAKQVDVSQDGLTYKVTLRDAKWSNGDSITAQDFVYSWRRTVNPATKAQDAFYFAPVKNATAITAGKQPVESLGIEATDKTHLTITLAQPTAYFKQLLAFPLFYPLNEKVVTKYNKEYATDATKQVYSGPYKLANWNGASDTWSLVKNDQYWDKQAVKLDTIKERVVKDPATANNLYKSGKLDETTLTGTIAQQQLQNADAINRRSSNLTRLDLNQKRVAAFKNKAIRQAFSLAIDRQALVKNILKDGSAAPLGFVPVGLAANPDTGKDFAKTTQVKSAVAYGLKQSQSLWAQGKKEANVDKLDLTLLADDSDNAKNTAEYIQAALQKLDGVTITVRSIPKAQRLQEQTSGNYDIVAATWQSVFADPYNFLDVWISNASYNDSGWANAQFDQLLADSELKYGNQPEKRWTALQQAERLLMADQATLPLFQANNLQLLNKKVKGINFNPSGVPYDFKFVTVK